VPRRQAAAEAQWGVSAKRAPVQGWIQAAAAHVDGSPSMSEMFDWYVGIDWASEVHQVCLVDDRGVVRGERAVRHNGEELAALAAWLIEGAAPERIAVGIELPHGPVVESLMERGFAVHALNPKQLDRFRFRFPGPRTRCPGAGRQPTPAVSDA
jgi:hypothetical protein